MFCKNCGNNIPEGIQFCPKCGTPCGGMNLEKSVVKTALGLPVNVMGAVTYFVGLVNPIVLLILVGYILLMESDKKLKADALKSGFVYLVFFGASLFVNILSTCFDAIEIIFNWFTRAYISFPLSLDSLCLNVLDVAHFVVVLFAVTVTLGGSGFYIRKVDSLTEKIF